MDLTKEMEKRVPEMIEKWTAVGMSTARADRPKAEDAIRAAYAAAELAAPKDFIWEESPVAGARTAARLATGDDDPTPEEVAGQLSNACYGSHDAAFLSFYDFFEPILPDVIKPLHGLMQVAQHCGWWWGFDDTVVVTERPVEIHVNDEGRLHSPDGPAILYGDGFSVYAWNGTRIPADFLEKTDEITAKEVVAEGNQEFKRILVEIIGWDRIISELGAKKVQMDDYGALYVLEDYALDDGEEVAKFVRVSDPSTDRKYMLRVPPDTKTARGGVAWTFDIAEEDYAPAQES